MTLLRYLEVISKYYHMVRHFEHEPHIGSKDLINMKVSVVYRCAVCSKRISKNRNYCYSCGLSQEDKQEEE